MTWVVGTNVAIPRLLWIYLIHNPLARSSHHFQRILGNTSQSERALAQRNESLDSPCDQAVHQPFFQALGIHSYALGGHRYSVNDRGIVFNRYHIDGLVGGKELHGITSQAYHYGPFPVFATDHLVEILHVAQRVELLLQFTRKGLRARAQRWILPLHGLIEIACILQRLLRRRFDEVSPGV